MTPACDIYSNEREDRVWLKSEGYSQPTPVRVDFWRAQPSGYNLPERSFVITNPQGIDLARDRANLPIFLDWLQDHLPHDPQQWIAARLFIVTQRRMNSP